MILFPKKWLMAPQPTQRPKRNRSLRQDAQRRESFSLGAVSLSYILGSEAVRQWQIGRTVEQCHLLAVRLTSSRTKSSRRRLRSAMLRQDGHAVAPALRRARLRRQYPALLAEPGRTRHAPARAGSRPR